MYGWLLCKGAQIFCGVTSSCQVNTLCVDQLSRLTCESYANMERVIMKMFDNHAQNLEKTKFQPSLLAKRRRHHD